MKEKFYRRKIRIEDILFLMIILATTAIIIRKLFGCLSYFATLITLETFLITSKVIIWIYVFTIDKNTSMEFMKVKNSFLTVKHEMEKIRMEMKNRFIVKDVNFPPYLYVFS
ncbi:MAG: hypothetical protein AABX16_05000 [Nanoarchaeota archaeon]